MEKLFFSNKEKRQMRQWFSSLGFSQCAQFSSYQDDNLKSDLSSCFHCLSVIKTKKIKIKCQLNASLNMKSFLLIYF